MLLGLGTILQRCPFRIVVAVGTKPTRPPGVEFDEVTA
jgi:hypothetical protein